MPSFTTSREFRHEQTVQAPQEEVLALLHNPQELCSLGPLYKSIVKDGKEEHSYVITDRLPIVGPIEGSTTFRAKLIPTSDGIQTDVCAALGTRLKTKYWAERKGDGNCVVKEITVVETPFITMPYVFATMSKAHISVMEKMAERWAKEPGQRS
ncbi:hypothetical protein MD484_g7023, partial [Candolleomyces efflorescens]